MKEIIKYIIPLVLRTKIRRYRKNLTEYVENELKYLKLKFKPKIFCIGNYKTGTTSFKKAMIDLGYIVGDQEIAERTLFYPYFRDKNFSAIIDYCKTAQVFQDFPFAEDLTYKYLDKAFPGSKFILTIRDNPEEWYNSLVTFHSKLWGKGNIPTRTDLENASYLWKGRPYESIQYKRIPLDDPYNKDFRIMQYVKHNEEVIDYFKNRPNDLLVINLKDKTSYNSLMDFLNIDSPFDDFPWENKTAELKIRE